MTRIERPYRVLISKHRSRVGCTTSDDAAADCISPRAPNAGTLKPSSGYSTARDVAVLTRSALSNEAFVRMVGTRIHWIRGPRQMLHRLRNLNQLLGRYRGAIGVKTGFTQAAGNCVVGAATRGDQSLVAVVLGDPAATAWRAAYSDVRNLLDFGFGLDLSSVARASIPVPVPSLLPGAEPSFLRGGPARPRRERAPATR